MIVGVSRALKEAGCKARIVALEPASSPVLTTGKGGRIASRGSPPDSGRRT
jgi:cysteine synthase